MGPTPQVAHVSITLDEVVPEVSRLVAVALGIRLDMLHLVIQAAMGWTNTHLWLIQARGGTWGIPDPDYPDDAIAANRTLLLDMVADIGMNRFQYVYDFGDHWSHTIKVVKPMPAVASVAYPLLIDAVGRCPMEDSGGPVGYMEMLDALRDPAHPRDAEVIAWPGPDFDPTNANHAKLEKDVADLAKLMTPRRRSSTKAKPSAKPRKSRGDDWFQPWNAWAVVV
ncbi:MAG: plasmid pRiA4b ORF-3 family protein, partial [Hyphomicrobiaceae bacterium]